MTANAGGLHVQPETVSLGGHPILGIGEEKRQNGLFETMGSVKAIGVLVAFAVVAMAILILGYGEVYPTYVVRYRLTVAALADGQPRSGSSVVEVRIKMQARLLDAPPWVRRVDGDPVFVDLGNGRNLVALLEPASGREVGAIGMAFNAFDIPILPKNAPDLANVSGERPLTPKDWPDFVTFRKTDDAGSIELLDPSSLDDAFGAKVLLESVTLTVTRDPVTHDFAKNYPWLAGPLERHDAAVFAKLRSGRH